MIPLRSDAAVLRTGASENSRIPASVSREPVESSFSSRRIRSRTSESLKQKQFPSPVFFQKFREQVFRLRSLTSLPVDTRQGITLTNGPKSLMLMHSNSSKIQGSLTARLRRSSESSSSRKGELNTPWNCIRNSEVRSQMWAHSSEELDYTKKERVLRHPFFLA